MLFAALTFPEINPEIFSFEVYTFRFALRWYALAYIIGILIGWRLCSAAIGNHKLWLANTPPLSKGQLDDLLVWIVVGVIIGGRLGFVFFYNPEYYLQNPIAILQVWQGGMSFHGGLIGVALAVLVYCLRNKLQFLSVSDVLALGTPAGLFLGRIANFVNNELWGRPTDLPWGVVFPGEIAQACPGVEGLCARHPSQLYEAFLEGIVLGGLLLFLAWRRGWLKWPGAVTGVFIAGYATARILVEFVRQPDTQFIADGNPVGHVLHFDGWGITMGQLLSSPMAILGAWLICITAFGWQSRKSHPDVKINK